MMKQVIAIMFLLHLVSCDKAPNDSGLCRDVYTAYCHRAHDCGTTEYLDECITYYFEICRTMRLHAEVDPPTTQERQDCLDAIPDLDCADLDPSNLEVCFFLRELPESDGDADVETDGDGDGDADSDSDNDAETDGDADSDVDADDDGNSAGDADEK